MLKIRPFEAWIRADLDQGVKITSYVAIRADEVHREGHSSSHTNLTVRLPFREAGVALAWGCPRTTGGGLEVVAHFASSSKRSNGCT
jgi:hypothetical protein